MLQRDEKGNLIDEVARLKELASKATQGKIGISRIIYEDGNHLLQLHRPEDRVGKTNFGAKHEDAKLLEGLRNAAPDLLAVLSGFQVGDVDEIDYAIDIVSQYQNDDDTVACLRRYRDMAQAMEEHR